MGRHSYPGLYVVFEGMGGAGKTTQMRLLESWLEPIFPKIICTRQPGGTHLSEKLRSLILNSKEGEEGISALTDTLLMAAARSDSLRMVSRFLEKGYLVFSDRCFLSSLVFQGIADEGIDLKTVWEINRLTIEAEGFAYPDLALIFETSTERSLSRIRERGDLDEDKFDKRKREYAEAVREGYRQLGTMFSNRTRMINGERGIIDIQVEIRDIVVAKAVEKGLLVRKEGKIVSGLEISQGGRPGLERY